MGIFSSKQKIASATLYYSKDKDKKIFINIQINDQEKIKELDLMNNKKIGAFIFLFYFDKNLFNMNESIFKSTLDLFHQTITMHLKIFMDAQADRSWENIAKELVSPNK